MAEYPYDPEAGEWEEPVEFEPPAEEIVYEEPIVEEPPPEPVYEEPAVEEPPPPEPFVEEAPPEPVYEEPVVEEPVVEEAPPGPIVEEPVAEEPPTEPVLEEPVADEPVLEEPVVEEAPPETVWEEPVAEEPVATEEEILDVEEPAPDLAAEPLDPELAEPGFVFTGDMSCWCESGAPEDWESWSPAEEPAADSWTEQGYSTDWGLVEAEWACDGEEPLDVAEPTLSSLVGPGHAADAHWAYQGDTNYCGLYSVNSVISEVYGQRVDIDEMVGRAAANGWLVYDENGQVKGIRPRDIDDVLASYGVGSRNFGGPDSPAVADGDAWRTLNDALANSRRVVLGVDGREFDQGGDVGVAGAIDMDHFVAVTGVDYARGVVIVNDSARAAGLEVPIDVFFESWRDSNFAMTLTDLSMPGDGTAERPGDATGPPADAPELASLGMTLESPEVAAGAQASALPEICCGDLAAPGDAGSSLLVAPAEPMVAAAEPTVAPIAQAAPPAQAPAAIPAASLVGPSVSFTSDNRLVIVPAAPPAGYAISAPLSNISSGPANWSYPGAGIDSGVSTLWNIVDRQNLSALNAFTGIPGDVGAYRWLPGGQGGFVRSGDGTSSLLPDR